MSGLVAQHAVAPNSGRGFHDRVGRRADDGDQRFGETLDRSSGSAVDRQAPAWSAGKSSKERTDPDMASALRDLLDAADNGDQDRRLEAVGDAVALVAVLAEQTIVADKTGDAGELDISADALLATLDGADAGPEASLPGEIADQPAARSGDLANDNGQIPVLAEVDDDPILEAIEFLLRGSSRARLDEPEKSATPLAGAAVVDDAAYLARPADIRMATGLATVLANGFAPHHPRDMNPAKVIAANMNPANERPKAIPGTEVTEGKSFAIDLSPKGPMAAPSSAADGGNPMADPNRPADRDGSGFAIDLTPKTSARAPVEIAPIATVAAQPTDLTETDKFAIDLTPKQSAGGSAETTLPASLTVRDVADVTPDQPADARMAAIAKVDLPAPAPQPGPTASNLVVALDSAWNTASADPVALRPLTAHTSAHGQSLKIQLHPAELGMVTANLSFVGDRLTVDLQVERQEAYNQLSTDSDTILKALRGLGLQVDQITIQQPQAAVTGQPKTDNNAALQNQAARDQQSSQAGQSGGNGDRAGGQASRGDGGDGRGREQGSARPQERAGSGLYI